MKPREKGLTRIIHATGYSLQGLKAAWKYEAAFRQEVILLAVLSAVTFILPIDKYEQLALIGSLALVIIVELINSAIEAVVDRTGADWHELSGRAKDIASAAVLITLIFAALIWTVILL